MSVVVGENISFSAFAGEKPAIKASTAADVEA
jgi:hypothetical protein